MGLKLEGGRDAITRLGKKAVFKEFKSSCWPAPYKFEVDGKSVWYSIGGYYHNHEEPSHDLDLVKFCEPQS